MKTMVKNVSENLRLCRLYVEEIKSKQKNNSPKQYFKYIDAIKGFAIILVVMGHVLAWMFDDYNVIYNNPSPSYLWRCIYSFHMPLFIFISGFLSSKGKVVTLNDFLSILSKRAKRLLIPFFIIGYIISLYRGTILFPYWYLLTLFEFVVLELVIEWLGGGKNWITVVMLIIVSLICIELPRLFGDYVWHKTLGDFSHLRLFQYFAFGIICSKYYLINKYLFNDILVFIAIVGFFSLLAFWKFRAPIPYCAIFIVMWYFSVYFNNWSKIMQNLFCTLGKYSLQIYLLHFFFPLKNESLGNFFILLSNNDKFHIVSSTTLQILYSVVVSSIIISICYLVINIISKNKFLRLIFGM